MLYLEVNGIKAVHNAYLNMYGGFEDESGSWVEPIYENVKKNWETIIDNCAQVYNDLIEINFSPIKDEIPIFKGSSGIVFILSPIDEIQYMSRWVTTYMIIGYKTEINESFKTSLYLFEDETKPKIDLQERKIIINEKTYEISYHYYTGFNIMELEEMPMLKFVYKLIGESMNKYFENIDKE